MTKPNSLEQDFDLEKVKLKPEELALLSNEELDFLKEMGQLDNLEDESLELENQSEINQNKSTKKKFKLGKIISLLLILFSISLLGFGGFTAYQVLNTADGVIVCEDGDEDCSNNPFSLIGDTVTGVLSSSENIKVKGEEEGRTNFLLIGKDAAANLTDTMILGSFYHKEEKLVTLNIPRDLFINASYQNEDGQTLFVNEKINALYSYAERDAQKPETAPRALAGFLESEFGIEIHYWAVTDFYGVEKVVDELDGVTVDVDKAFTDCEYPNENYGFLRPCPSFEVGPEKMDGERALIYARSRKGVGDSGDFARSRRQTIVIKAVAEEAKSKGILANLNSINTYVEIFADSVVTNVKPSEVLAMYKKYGDADLDKVFERVIWDDGGGILCTGDPSRGYNLVYCGGAIPGRQSNSFARTQARNQVQNLLSTALTQKIADTRIAILGNQSNDTTKVRTAFTSVGFENIYFSNNYRSQITSATPTSVEKATAYIIDSTILQEFKEIAKNIDYEIEIVEGLPPEKTLPNGAEDAKIAIWVESI